jgi:hypothetical protein
MAAHLLAQDLARLILQVAAAALVAIQVMAVMRRQLIQAAV